MSNITTPNLPAATALTGAEQIAAVQNGSSVRVTASQIAGTSPIAPTVFSGLPAPSGALTGASAFITDALSATYLVGQVISIGGGSNGIRVSCNGVAWVAG